MAFIQRYSSNALATQIDSLGASLQLTKSADDLVKYVGENINYTLIIKNTGQLTATNIQIDDIITEGTELVPKTFIKEGEQTTQQVTFTNTSNYVLQNLFFTDSLGDGAEHVAGSVVIDGISFPSYDVISGFSLPDLPVGNNTTILYTVVANNPKTKSIVDNFATLQFSVSDPVSGSRTFNQDTNTVSFAVISTNLIIILILTIGVIVAITGALKNVLIVFVLVLSY